MKSDITDKPTSLQGLDSGLMPSSLPNGHQTDLFGQVHAPVSHSAAQEEKKAQARTGTYGLIGIGSSKSASLQKSLESKLQARLPMAGSIQSLMIWKRKTTPSRRQYCQLALSDRRVQETDYGLWQSPRSTMIIETPQNFQARNNRRQSRDRGKFAMPNLAVQALWATPNCMDFLPPISEAAMSKMYTGARKGRSAPSNLREQVLPLMYPNSGEIPHGLPAPMDDTDQLNPEFACWLMGIPTMMLSSMQSAMASFRKSPPNSSKLHYKGHYIFNNIG